MYNQGYRPPQQGTPYQPQGNWYAPPPQPPQQGRSRKRTQQPPSQPPGKQRKKRSWKWQLVKLLLLLVLIGGACAGLYVWKTRSEVEPYQNVFLDHVSVDGIDLSGKTWAEGSQLVWDQVNQKQNGWYVRLRNARGDYKDITAETLGISFDPTAALEQAWAVGHDGTKNIFELQQDIEVAKATTSEFFSAEQSADTTPIDSILQTLEYAAYRAPSDAQILSFNPDDSKNPFTYRQEVYGQRLDTTAIRAQILDMVQNLQSGEILLETQVIYPSVTVEQLSQSVQLLNRAVTPISSSSPADRTENIRTAFSKINGMVLENGAQFSFNSTVGRRSLENGFLPAVEYVYGRESMGIGGGVCQASTTLYLAAIQSGMTILKREPHSMAVSYTELGMDATVSDTRGREIDFAFRNESGSPIYIAAHVVQSSTNKRNLLCEVRIYGQSLAGKSYKLVAETVETLVKPVEPIMKEDEDHNYVTYIDETHTIKGRDGYVVDAYLVAYENGVEIARNKVSTDTYPSKADTVYYGTETRFGGF